MKKSILLLLLATFVFVSCEKMVINAPMVIEEEEINMENNSDILLSGDFKGAAHPTSGMAQVIEVDGVKKLRFINFKTDSGPDLRVYLAEDNNAKNFIQVSNKVQNGNLEYEIPMEADLTKQTNVLIWCKLFSVNFGSAELKMP